MKIGWSLSRCCACPSGAHLRSDSPTPRCLSNDGFHCVPDEMSSSPEAVSSLSPDGFPLMIVWVRGPELERRLNKPLNHDWCGCAWLRQQMDHGCAAANRAFSQPSAGRLHTIPVSLQPWELDRRQGPTPTCALPEQRSERQRDERRLVVSNPRKRG